MSQPIVSDAGPWITFARAGQFDDLIHSGFRLKRTLYEAKLRHAREAPS